MTDDTEEVEETVKDKIKSTKYFLKYIEEGIKTKEASDLDELNKKRKAIKKADYAEESSSISKAEKKLDLDSINDLNHEIKLEAKEKIKFLKDCEKILVGVEKENEKEREKSSIEIIKEFNEMFVKGMEKFTKDTQLSRSDEKKLVKEFEKNFE